MKPILILVISMSFVAPSFSQKTDGLIPSFDKLNGVRLGIGARWAGCIFPNGSATLIYGSSDSADVPEGSFSFEEIYNLLVPHLKEDEGAEAMWVWLVEPEETPEETSLPTFYLADKEVMRKIMHELCDKAVPTAGPWTKTRFETLLRKYPLVPGDPPYLKAEEHIKSEVKGQKAEVVDEVKEAGVGDREKGVGDREEVTGAGAEEEVPPPVGGGKARKTGRPSLFFYVGAGVLVCVGVVLFLTRRR